MLLGWVARTLMQILLLNIELELKSERDNAEVRLTDPTQYQSIVDAEWNIIYSKLDACIATGAKIVLSRLPIGDLATQYFADRNVFCAGRVEAGDMERVAKATGAIVQVCASANPNHATHGADVFGNETIATVHTRQQQPPHLKTLRWHKYPSYAVATRFVPVLAWWVVQSAVLWVLRTDSSAFSPRSRRPP
jgi:hypothetical protein